MKPFNKFCYGPSYFGGLFVLMVFHSVAVFNGSILLVSVRLLHAFLNLHVWLFLIRVYCLTCWAHPTNVYHAYLYLIGTSAGLKSWITSEFHSYVNMEVLYMFCKIPTSHWLLVNVWNLYVTYILFLDSTIYFDLSI